MFMNIAIGIISVLTGTFYYCNKAAVNEKYTVTEELISSSKTTNVAPTRPPRKPRYNNRKFEIEEKYPSISNRSTTSESSIDGRGIKVVTAQIEGQPNSLRSVVLPSRDADPTSDVIELRRSRRRSFVMSPQDK
ncbi:uncharacterized protein V1478_011140 [Vespula squamosa]|uniref:Uncharacterized protein n=1 Tax=Vespula squamosa TaxID=30214 RepID=A0ABD2AGE1_VESSQ